MARTLLLCSAALALASCRITPEEISVIEAENELLRVEIQRVKENCTYYRELEVRPADQADEPDESSEEESP